MFRRLAHVICLQALQSIQSAVLVLRLEEVCFTKQFVIWTYQPFRANSCRDLTTATVEMIKAIVQSTQLVHFA